MGRERNTSDTESNQQQTQEQTQAAQETPRESQFLDQFSGFQGALQQGATSTGGNMTNLINMLLTGQNLPGNLGQISQGISPEAIGQASTRAVGQNAASFNKLGILDSGTAFKETAADVASRVQLPAEQFNISTLLNALQLGFGGQGQLQQGALGGGSVLAQSLAGLRPVTSTGSGSTSGSTSTTTTGMNPFLKSLQQSAGQTLGSPSFSAGPFGF